MENWSLGLRRRRVLFQLAKNQLNKKEKRKMDFKRCGDCWL
jgi:hypothetical protein